MKKRLFALICAVCMITVMAAHGHAEKEEYTVTEKSVAMYISSVENKQDFKVYYINGGCIPYISVRNVGTLIEISSIIGTDGGYSPFLHLKTDGDHAVYTLADGPYTMDIDFTHDTITFMDYDAFYRAEDLALVDLVWTPPYMSKLFRKSELCMDRYGKVLTFDLGHYGIDLVHTADGYYLPVQTVIDLLLSYYCNTVVFNGEALIFGPLDAELTAVLYDGSGEWNEEFALFNYNELCCALDYQYGLKDIHGIETFDQLFTETGLKNDFLSDDETKADQALYKLIKWYLGDIHSAYTGFSYMTDVERMKNTTHVTGLAEEKVLSVKKELLQARNAAYPEGIPAYEEIGNTAYITFDQFMDPDVSVDYYALPTEADNSSKDTVKLIQYACAQILREGSPVKNVVLDLSLNGGGSTLTAEYVMAAFLRDADFSTKNMMTGAMSDAIYTVDTNLDGVFDEKDTLEGKGLRFYCLASPASFSCGNLVPCVFKASHKVTLLGNTSGGGSCSVYSLSTASCSRFNISGYRRFSVMKNGSFYDIDLGEEPHYYIADPEKYYNREALTQFINSLY